MTKEILQSMEKKTELTCIVFSLRIFRQDNQYSLRYECPSKIKNSWRKIFESRTINGPANKWGRKWCSRLFDWIKQLPVRLDINTILNNFIAFILTANPMMPEKSNYCCYAFLIRQNVHDHSYHRSILIFI